MIRHLTLAKVSKGDSGYRFLGSASDDRVDSWNTRLDREIFLDFSKQTYSHGMPFLGVAHYPDSKIGIMDQMWVDGHYLKVGGLFDEGELAEAAIKGLLADTGHEIQQSVGFYPRRVAYEDDVLVYLRGWLEHSALTVVPVNTRTDVMIIQQSAMLTRWDDACAIVGSHFADKLEEVERGKRKKQRANIEGRTLYIPDLSLGQKLDSVLGALCAQIAAPMPLVVFSNTQYEQPGPLAPKVFSINEDLEEWLERISGEVDLGSDPLCGLSRILITRHLDLEIDLSDEDVIELMAKKPSYAYLERLVSILKETVPPEKWKNAYKLARGHAGGKGSPVTPTSISTEDFKATPDSRISDLTHSTKIPQMNRAMLAIIEANQNSKLADEEKLANISRVMGEFRREIIGMSEAEGILTLEEQQEWLGRFREMYTGIDAVKAPQLSDGMEGRPFPNEHACRLRDPGGFQKGSIRRTTRKHDGKTYSVIMGRLEGETTMTEQAYRYPKDNWSAVEARGHCGDHDGSFEVASKEQSLGAELVGSDKLQQIVLGVVLEPDVPDVEGFVASVEVIERACHKFGSEPRQIWIKHKSKVWQATVVENYCAPQDLTFEHQGFGRQMVKKGTWIVGIKIDDPNIWALIEDGQLIGLSLRALITLADEEAD